MTSYHTKRPPMPPVTHNSLRQALELRRLIIRAADRGRWHLVLANLTKLQSYVTPAEFKAFATEVRAKYIHRIIRET